MDTPSGVDQCRTFRTISKAYECSQKQFIWVVRKGNRDKLTLWKGSERLLKNFPISLILTLTKYPELISALCPTCELHWTDEPCRTRCRKRKCCDPKTREEPSCCWEAENCLNMITHINSTNQINFSTKRRLNRNTDILFWERAILMLCFMSKICTSDNVLGPDGQIVELI